MISLLRRPLFTRWLLTIAAVVALCPPPVFTQEADNDKNTVVVPHLGTQIFRSALLRQKIEPLTNITQIHQIPHKTIIILLGEKSISTFVGPDLQKAVRAGATLLIASDASTRGTLFQRSQISKLFGVELTSDGVVADASDCFHGDRRSPFVQPFRDFAADETSPKYMFQQLSRDGKGALATNIATVLHIEEKRQFKLVPLANFPISAKSQRTNAPLGLKDLFAAAGEVGNGRFLVMSDHSIFENYLVWKTEENSNLFFTQDCIKWLKGDNEEAWCLFVEDGIVQTEFALKLPDRDIDPFKVTKFIINNYGSQLLTELEEDGKFNTFILGRLPLWQLIRIILFTAIGLVLFYGFRLLLRGRMRADPARTLVTPELAELIPRGNVLQQRFEGQLDSDNVYEPARELVREFMSGLDAAPDAQGRAPQIEIVDGCENAAGLRRRIMQLWAIGYGRTPVKVAPREWPQLSRDLQGILLDADEGWWKFVARE